LAPWAEATNGSAALTAVEYRAELDRLLLATQQLDSSGRSTPQELHDLPSSWNVHLERGDFDISTEGLRREIRRYESDPNADKALAIRKRIEDLREHLEQYEKPPTDISAERSYLNSVLARPEFSQVRGPGWVDRLKAALLNFVLRALGRLFRTVAIPSVGKALVYGLIVLAVLALAYLVYRNIVWGTDFEKVTPADVPVSAKEWAVWLAEARACAAQGDWRSAIHLAYWAGISFLERQGAWKPDRARTPREYLRLLSGSSEHRETLARLTRIFELAWYAKRDATESTFSQTLDALEKLGCR
jgi:hypothetical protein